MTPLTTLSEIVAIRPSLLRKIVCLFLTLLFVPKGMYGQGHDDLLKIIESTVSDTQKETQLDIFISEYLPKLPLLERAECLHDLGGMWHYQRFLNSGDDKALKNAIKLTLKSLQLKRKLEYPDRCSINRTLYNLGLFYADSSKEYRALDYLLELIREGGEYCQGTGNEQLIELGYHEVGDLYMKIGDFYKALEIFNTLISDYTKEHLLHNEGAVWAFLRRAEIYSAMDLKENADLIKDNLDRTLDCLKKSGIPCCFFENRINQLEGNRLSEINSDAESIVYYHAVIENLPEKDSVNLAIAYNSLGYSYFKLGKKKLAEKTLLKAALLNGDFDSPYNNLGDVYSHDHQFERALSSYQKAIDLSIRKTGNLQFDELPEIVRIQYAPNKIELLNHLVTKANGWLDYYYFDGNEQHLIHSLETFTLADQLVDLIRSESTEQQSKLFWREKGASLYMKAVEVCHLLNRPQLAFHFMERNKALLLLEDLTNEEAKEIANLPDTLAQREFYLKRAIFLIENSLQQADKAQEDVVIKLKDSLRESKYRYRQFVDSLSESYDDYAKFKKKAEVMNYKNLQENYISGNKAVLHYILNESQGFGLLSVSDTTLLFTFNSVLKLNEDIEKLIVHLSDGLSDFGHLQALSNKVFRQLVPEEVYSRIQGKELTLIPDYSLQRIPFGVLVTNAQNNNYLIEEVEIAYAYSISLLERIKQTEKKTENDFLGVAPVSFKHFGLADLDFSKSEINKAETIFNGKTIFEDKATKQQFVSTVGNHNIVHLATHADVGEQENPWIAFSDEKMYLKEIYATKNQADMVVLSGCNTSNGALKPGEGVMSLARGFFYSGAKSVVSTLWPITDETGKDILINFYENLDRGNTKSMALRKAKLDYLKNTKEEELKHPFYWAGIVLVGDNSALTHSYDYDWVLVTFVIIAIGFFILKSIPRFRRKY